MDQKNNNNTTEIKFALFGYGEGKKKKKYEIAKHFKDDRYKEISIRILYEIAPHTLPENDKRNYEFEIKERFNDDDKSKWNSKNKILSSLDTDLDKMITDENEKVQFKQKVITFLNNESAKWD